VFDAHACASAVGWCFCSAGGRGTRGLRPVFNELTRGDGSALARAPRRSEVGQGFAGGGEAEGPAEQGGGGGAAAAAAAGGGALPTSEREWLLADRQQQLVPELLEVGDLGDEAVA
jgi:hypothetical protein